MDNLLERTVIWFLCVLIGTETICIFKIFLDMLENMKKYTIKNLCNLGIILVIISISCIIFMEIIIHHLHN